MVSYVFTRKKNGILGFFGAEKEVGRVKLGKIHTEKGEKDFKNFYSGEFFGDYFDLGHLSKDAGSMYLMTGDDLDAAKSLLFDKIVGIKNIPGRYEKGKQSSDQPSDYHTGFGVEAGKMVVDPVYSAFTEKKPFSQYEQFMISEKNSVLSSGGQWMGPNLESSEAEMGRFDAQLTKLAAELYVTKKAGNWAIPESLPASRVISLPRGADGKIIYTSQNNMAAIWKSKSVWGVTEGKVYGMTIPDAPQWRTMLPPIDPSKDPGVIIFKGPAANLFSPHEVWGPFSGFKRLAGQQTTRQGDIIFEQCLKLKDGPIIVTKARVVSNGVGHIVPDGTLLDRGAGAFSPGQRLWGRRAFDLTTDGTLIYGGYRMLPNND